MTDTPSAWALARTKDVLWPPNPDLETNIALALDAAYRAGIESAARIAELRAPVHGRSSQQMPDPLRGAWFMGVFFRIWLWIDRR